MLVLTARDRWLRLFIYILRDVRDIWGAGDYRKNPKQTKTVNKCFSSSLQGSNSNRICDFNFHFWLILTDKRVFTDWQEALALTLGRPK